MRGARIRVTTTIVTLFPLALVLGGGTCLVERISDGRAPPRIVVDEEVVGAPGPRCLDRWPPPLLGAPPRDARVVVRLHATSSQPVPLRALEVAMGPHLVKHCVDGLAVLRASTPDGAEGADDVLAVGYVSHDESGARDAGSDGDVPDAGHLGDGFGD
jgi:hypothetical protein